MCKCACVHACVSEIERERVRECVCVSISPNENLFLAVCALCQCAHVCGIIIDSTLFPYECVHPGYENSGSV